MPSGQAPTTEVASRGSGQNSLRSLSVRNALSGLLERSALRRRRPAEGAAADRAFLGRQGP